MDSSKAPVVVLVAIILMGAIIWGVWAVRSSSGIDPERAKTLAEEAERECVLLGFPPERCPKLVGRHHRDCLNRVVEESDGPIIKDAPYLECMKSAFGTPSGGESSDAGSTGDDASHGVDSSDHSVGETPSRDAGDAER